MGGSSTTIGYWYLLAFHHGLCKGPIDAFGEFRGGNKTAWTGQMTASGGLPIYASELWGGEKDQGGIEGTLRVMFGEADQMPNSYLVSTFGEQTAAWRGMTTVAFEGGKYGAMNPYPQKPAYRVRRIVKGWDGDYCWYEAKAPVPLQSATTGTPGAGTYRWAMLHTVGAYVAVSPEGEDWSNDTALPTGYGSEINVGDYVLSTAPNGDTAYAPWTDPAAWQEGPNVGAFGFFQARTSLVDGRIFQAKGNAGYAYADSPAGPYTNSTDRARLIIGNADWVVRYAGPNAGGFSDGYQVHRSSDGGTTFALIWTIPLGGEGSDSYAYYLEAGGSNAVVNAIAGRDYNDNTVCFYSEDGFATPLESTMPAGMTGDLRQLLYIEGEEWLALVNGGECDDGPAPLLRSTDNLASFQRVDLGLSETADVFHEFMNNMAVDRRDGRVELVLGTSSGPKAFLSDNRTSWEELDLTFGPNSVYLIAPDDPGSPGTPDRVCMNPVHMLLYSHTQHDTGRESFDTVNLDHATIQADWYFDERFGLCTARRPEAESPAEFRGRIEKVAACSFTRSMADGLWYVDIANGVYEFDDLPILTDDDVLDFRETPTVLSDAINSVSVKYFDPWRKESVVTPPIRAMGLVAEYGEIHQTYDYPEIPTGPIAVRVATRELLSSVTPTRRFDLATTRKPYSWRRNTYFRLQLPKRGITDMVCLLAELQHGQLKSGAIKLKAVQDIYSLPTTVYTEVEEGVDTNPSQTPLVVADQRAMEAPYLNLVGSMRALEFDALEPDVGFAVGIAADPGRSRDFTMMVAPSGGTYAEKDNGDFCPTALSVGAVEPGNSTGITLASGKKLAQVALGSLVLWDDEICRVDALDVYAGTVDLGRGCADTVPALHLAGSRLFFYTDYAAADPTEYTDGETLDIKLLTNTGSKRLPLASATAMALTMQRRMDRPLPPGGLLLNGETFYASGAITPVPPGGGGGGGSGGGGPSTPPATGSNGAPASQELGPDGGFPDNGPPLYPQPTTFGVNVIDDPSMDDPATLSRWRRKDGTPLGPEWDLVGGKLQLQAGVGTYEAYDFGTRFSKPYMPFPRLVIDTAADVQNTPGTLSSIGVAWGTWQSSNMPEYLEVSDPAAYLDEDTVTHSWAQEIKHAGGGVGIIGEYSVINFVPMVRHVVTTELATATIDNVDMQITLIDPAVTTETITNLDLSAGLTGITLWPDPSDTNPYLPDISVVGGVAIADFHTEGFDYRWLIFDDPLTEWDLDHFARLALEGWSNDATILSNSSKKLYPFGGVTAGLAYKNPGGDLTAISAAGRVERGDFTPREYYHHIAHAAASGFAVHAAVLMVGSVGTQAKFRNFTVATTDDAYPESP